MLNGLFSSFVTTNSPTARQLRNRTCNDDGGGGDVKLCPEVEDGKEREIQEWNARWGTKEDGRTEVTSLGVLVSRRWET